MSPENDSHNNDETEDHRLYLAAQAIMCNPTDPESALRARCEDDEVFHRAQMVLARLLSPEDQNDTGHDSIDPLATLDPIAQSRSAAARQGTSEVKIDPVREFNSIPTIAAAAASGLRGDPVHSQVSALTAAGLTAAGLTAAGQRYHRLKQHAQGGLGVVYRAKDIELGRIVAFKQVLDKYKCDDDVVQRFRHEAGVTGSLEHPGIVPVYGLGTDSEGHPFYTMRFIEGKTLTSAINAFHDQRHHRSDRFLSREFRQLIRRFLDCCNTLHYAHRQAVLHRDLKPDNIMLGDFGETLLVDWGLALQMSNRSTTRGLSVTDEHEVSAAVTAAVGRDDQGTLVGTPMYMSPEQSLGFHDQLTPASDVYSLGATLFNILTNDDPFDRSLMTKGILREKRNGNVRDIRSINPWVPQPLISICRKAMAHDPKSRYQSANELAQDLDRWLADDAVDAHCEGVVERTGRLIRRHRRWTVPVGVSLIAVTGISILAAVFINRARNSEATAHQRAAESRSTALQRYQDSRSAIDTWLVQSSEMLAQYPGTEDINQRLLRLAAQDYEKLASIEEDDHDLALERGRVLIRLGQLNRQMFDDDLARAHFSDAIELFQSQRELLPVGFNKLQRLYQAEEAHALSQRAAILPWEEAEKDFQRAIEQLDGLTKNNDAVTLWRYLGFARLGLADRLISQGELDSAKETLNTAIDNFAPLIEFGEVNDLRGVARVHQRIGTIEMDQGRIEAATEQFRMAEAILTEAASLTPDHQPLRESIASLWISQAKSLHLSGHTREAQLALQRAVELYEQAGIQGSPRHVADLAMALTNLATTLLAQDQCVLAQRWLEKAEPILRASSDAYPTAWNRIVLSTNLDVQGQTLLALGKAEQSAFVLQTAVQTLEQLDDREAIERTALCRSHLCQTLLRINDDPVPVEIQDFVDRAYQDAANQLQQLISSEPRTLRFQNELAHVYHHYAEFLTRIKDARASDSYVRARDLWVAMGLDRGAATSERLAFLLMTCPDPKVKDIATAQRYASEALQQTPGNTVVRCTAALSHLLSGDLEQASTLLDQLGDETSGRLWYVRSLVHRQQGDSEAARVAMQRAEELFEQHGAQVSDILVLRSLFDRKQPEPGKDR